MKVYAGKSRGRFDVLNKVTRKLASKKNLSLQEERILGDSYREAIRLYHDEVSKKKDLSMTAEDRKMLSLAKKGMHYLGGEGDVNRKSLKYYNHKKYGPYLGVSDEGSAADAIIRAALDSPKARSMKKSNPLTLGLALDAEHLGGIGEVAVGPCEYVNIRTACMGKILNSTNIGTRVNLRFYKRYPIVTFAKGEIKSSLKKAEDEIKKVFNPFLHPPGGKPRPLLVYVEFEDKRLLSKQTCISVLKSLKKYAENPDVSDMSVHKLGYQVRIGWGKKGRDAAIYAIDIASATGIRDVAIDGVVRKQADESLSQPGLLDYIAPGLLGPVLRHANQKNIDVHPVNIVDTDTVANHIWSALHTARQMGFELGKYGMFPLTLEECDAVTGKIQSWYKDWSAAPVFFVDQGLVSAKQVDTHGDVMRGLTTWLKMVAKHRVEVVLIDTIDKAKSPPLLRLPEEKKGILTTYSIQKIEKLAESLKIKVLWAGGITLPQAYEMGRLGVFGIYVTTAAASLVPVSRKYKKDPGLAAVKEPTYEGVYRVKLLMESGYLREHLNNRKLCGELEIKSREFMEALQKGDSQLADKKKIILSALTLKAWRLHNIK